MAAVAPVALPLVAVAAGSYLSTAESRKKQAKSSSKDATQTAAAANAAQKAATVNAAIKAARIKAAREAAKIRAAQEAARIRAAQKKTAEVTRKRLVQERKEQSDLKRRLAKLRARYGAAGLLNSGSADAVLANLRRETEQRIADGKAADLFRVNEISQSAQSAIKDNLIGTGSNLLNGWVFGEGG